MKIKPNSSVFSVRVETNILESFDRLVGANSLNRNAFIKDLMVSEIFRSKENKKIPFEAIPISRNQHSLGYIRSFFTREDAELVHQGSLLLLKEINERTGRFLQEETEEEKEIQIQNLLVTGVKYDFSKSDFTLFSVFNFIENRDDSNEPILDIGYLLFGYDKKKDVFEDYTDYDYFPIKN